MLGVGAERFDRNVIESFVEHTMDSYFTTLRLDIIPNDISCGMWDITKKNTFTGFVLEPLCLDAWCTDPDSANKSTKILEVVFFSVKR